MPPSQHLGSGQASGARQRPAQRPRRHAGELAEVRRGWSPWELVPGAETGARRRQVPRWLFLGLLGLLVLAAPCSGTAPLRGGGGGGGGRADQTGRRGLDGSGGGPPSPEHHVHVPGFEVGTSHVEEEPRFQKQASDLGRRDAGGTPQAQSKPADSQEMAGPIVGSPPESTPPEPDQGSVPPPPLAQAPISQVQPPPAKAPMGLKRMEKGLTRPLETLAQASQGMEGGSPTLTSGERTPGMSPSESEGAGECKGKRGAGGISRHRSRKMNPAIFRVPSVGSIGSFPSPDSYGFSHNENLGFSIFLERRCKWVWFIRHAEAEHNLAEREHELGTKYLLEEHSGWKYWDAALTQRGKHQCNKLRRELEEMERYLDWELCVVSPLTRTLQTARLTVGAVRHEGEPIKFLATEMCRERVTLCPADSRRNKSVLQKEFPEVDFSQVKDEFDIAWRDDKEDDEACKQRGIRFLQWLAKRRESCITVVTHSGFLKRLFEQFGMGIASEDMEELHRRPANCEMRGLVLCAHRQFEGGATADLVMMPMDDEMGGSWGEAGRGGLPVPRVGGG